MTWIWLFLVVLLIYIGFDYGRLIINNRRLQNYVGEEDTKYTPSRHIMFRSSEGFYISKLAKMSLSAHQIADVGIKSYNEDQDGKYMKIVFDNKDELIVYEYGAMPIDRLSKQEIDNYEHKIFFDYKLPEGAERAIIEQLGLTNYMVNIGICSEKCGGK